MLPNVQGRQWVQVAPLPDLVVDEDEGVGVEGGGGGGDGGVDSDQRCADSGPIDLASEDEL